jgi:hypothetical protein
MVYWSASSSEIFMKYIAFHLPQFHPIPENNEWWGQGFTEWTNVAKARPMFRGHHQPQLPADLGFYDLRLAQARQGQADLASEYGLGGFCYYHYWFNGKLLLEQPIEEILASQQPDFPFCLCWANENWTRAWDGMERQVLMRQDYTLEDSKAHMIWLCRYFKDSRYIRVNGKPLFLIYRTDLIPDLAEHIQLWREIARQEGVGELYLVTVRGSFKNSSHDVLKASGIDAEVDFQPNIHDLYRRNFFFRAARRLIKEYNTKMDDWGVGWMPRFNAYITHDYQKLKKKILAKPVDPNQTVFPCVFPSWDNTPRRREPGIIQNLDASAFEDWLKSAAQRVQHQSSEEQIVFINAWNEWAEGCHLEPDTKLGRRFLEALGRVTGKIKK